MNTAFNRLPLLMGLLMTVQALPGADLPNAPSRQAPEPAIKVEFKLLVDPANTAQAITALKLNEPQAAKQTVCFFDTRDGVLAANHLILRARQTAGGATGESTVKLRVAENETDLSATERAIPPEQDWTQETAPTLSRSLDHAPLATDLLTKVVAGKVPAAGLFDDAQRQLVTVRIKDFKWEDLICYGPVATRVWRQAVRFQGFAKPVTVELWHLRKDDRTLDLLEASAKARPADATQAQALARQFYAAAKTAGLGEPTNLTKTQLVMEFFKPGGHGNP